MNILKTMLIMIITLCLTVPVYEAEAAKYKSSSSRSSFSSRSVSKPPVTRPSTPKYSYSAPKQSTKYKSTSSNSYNSTASQYKAVQNKQQSASAYKSTQSKPYASPANKDFKQAPAYTSTAKSPSTSSYGSNSSRSYNNSNRYSTSKPNTVIVRESGGFDLGDVAAAALVGSMLSDDSAQVAALQQQVNQLQKSVPGSVPAANIGNVTANSASPSAPLIDKTALPTINFCAGPNGQNYHNYGAVLNERASKYNLNVIATKGSLDNFDKLSSGECDAAIVQRDSYSMATNLPSLHRVASPYADEALLMCSKSSGVVKVSQLTEKHTIALLPTTSGSRATWANISNTFNVKPTTVQTDNVQAQLMKLSDGSVDCAFSVTTTTAKVFNMSNMLKLPEKVNMVHIDYSELDEVVDLADQPVYYSHTITGSKNFHLKGVATVFGVKVWSTKASSISVPNDVVLSAKFMENKQDLATNIITDVDAFKL